MQTSAERTGGDNMVRERSTVDHSDVMGDSTQDRGVDFGAFLPDLRSRRGSVGDRAAAATTPTRETGLPHHRVGPPAWTLLEVIRPGKTQDHEGNRQG